MDKIIQEFPEKIRKKLGSHIKKIILFGSRARGDYNNKSDYDFLIIVDNLNESIKETIFDEILNIENEHDELINSIIWDENESNKYFNYPIGINIKKQGIEL